MRKLSLRETKKRFINCMLWGTIGMLVGLFVGYMAGWGWGGAVIVGSGALMLYGWLYAVRKLRCPRCGNALDGGNDLNMELFSYCPHCGTEIDWDAK